MKIKRDNQNEYRNNKLDDLLIRGREIRTSKIYELFEGSNRAFGKRDIITYMWL